MLMAEESPLERPTRRQPHYARTTVTHSAPEFANHEQDVIRQSFATGNYTWMKEALPVELGPDAVNMLRRQRMERNRLAEPVPQTWSKMTQLWGGGYYPEFEYLPDAYERRMDFERSLREESVKKREKISHQDWRQAGQEVRLKHESLIDNPNEKEHFPHLPPGRNMAHGPFKYWLRVGMDSTSGATWGHGSEAPESSFLAGRGKGLEDDGKSSRMSLPTIVQRLQRRVELDWEGTTVIVSATEQDLVQVAFHMATVDSERGVQAYMGVLSKDDELLGTLGLRKLSQLWGMQRDFSAEGLTGSSTTSGGSDLENTWMFFLFMPKWVRMRPTDAYYTVHPRETGSAFRMSGAGSSVLLSALGTTQGIDLSTSQRSTNSNNKAPASAREHRSAASAAAAPPGRSDKVDLSLALKAASKLPPIRENRSGAYSAR